MNNNEKYFVSLISSYLNQDSPALPMNDIDWAEIYRLSSIHNVCAVVASQAFKLKDGYKPDDKTASLFRQQIGYTVIDAERKNKAIDFIKEFLSKNDIDFIMVKGAVLRNYYPIADFRTSSDIDVIIRDNDFKKCMNLLKVSKHNIKSYSANEISVFYNNIHIEIHSETGQDNAYFNNIFNMCKSDGNEYVIGKEDHLLYVMCHIIKHFNHCGAGIKMFMDIDAIIRNTENFNYNDFINLCKKLKIDTFAKSSFALCRYWFNTPVKSELDFTNQSQLRDLFENEIIKSGTFGFNMRNLGDFYINKAIGKDGKNNFLSKLRAFFIFLFPPKKALKSRYEYLNKRPYLLPAAWFSRLFEGLFCRFGHSKNTILSIAHTGSDSEDYKKLLNELKI